jgi:hypothetical protein
LKLASTSRTKTHSEINVNSKASQREKIRINIKISVIRHGVMERVASDTSNASGVLQTNAINGYDVLLGRGGLTNSHIGNKRFRLVVTDYQLEYLMAKKREKKVIAKRIVDQIYNSGGRFLRKSPVSNVWSEVTEKKALEKASQSLRESLDVRHKKFRPEKIIRQRDTDDLNPRKRSRLVKGMVMESPKLASMVSRPSAVVDSSGGGVADDDIPDLKAEDGLETSACKLELFFNFSPPEAAEEDCENVSEI